MKTTIKSILSTLVLSSLSTMSWAGDAGAGKAVYMAKGCAGCHGPMGISALPNYPNLAGQKEQYVTTSLNAYKAGQRNSPNAAAMKPMAAMLNDNEIADVAAFVAGIK